MGGKFKLLVAEDDANDQKFLDHLLGRAGLGCMFQVGTGEAVVDYLSGAGAFRDRKAHPYPDLLLLDLGLPRLSGLEVLEWIAQTPKLPPLSIYVLTGLVDVSLRRRVERYNVAGYFQKPMTLAQVAWMLEDHMAVSA